MPKYTISQDSPHRRASVGKKDLVAGGDPVELTKEEVKLLEDAGDVVLEEASKSSSGSDSGSGKSSNN